MAVHTQRLFAALLTAGLSILAAFALAPSQVAAQPGPKPPARPPATFAPQGLSGDLLGATGQVRVYVLLRSQPVLAALQNRGRQGAISGRIAGFRSAQAGARSNPRHLGRRERIFAGRAEVSHNRVLRRIGKTGNNASADQQPVVKAIHRLGGNVIVRSPAPNYVMASLPAAGLAKVASMPGVQAVSRAPVLKPQLELADQSMGATTWWDAGYTGGRGGSDTSPADVAVIDNLIDEDHPAFAGVDFERPGAACTGMDALHGTAATGAIVSQDPVDRGLAYGADKLLDACFMFPGGNGESWALGIDQGEVAGASDPAEVISWSSGGMATADDSADIQRIDSVASAFNISYVLPAGNQGPAVAVSWPGIAWNAISVGAMNDMGTTDPSDDIIASYSSLGASPGGRKKPDLVAMGGRGGGRDLTLPDANWRLDGHGTFAGFAGTSFATPIVAAGAQLLAGAGVADSMARKAILIDSARPFEDQATWRRDSGWGILDLDQAFQQRGNYALGSIGAGEAKFYAASANSADKATLAWYRRVVTPNYPSGYEQTAYTLSDLNLTQYDRATMSPQSASESVNDSVEQVRAPAQGESVYKVRDASATVDGADSEPYALASTRPSRELNAPTLDQKPGQGVIELAQGQEVVVDVPIQNTGDLSESWAEMTLNPSDGVEIVSGDQTQTVGGDTLDPGETATAQWTVRAAEPGAYKLPVTAAATGWGESFRSDSSIELTVDDTVAPMASVGALPKYTGSEAFDLKWSGSDGRGAGIRNYDLQYRDDDGSWNDLLTDTDLTSAGFTGQDGHTYGFRIRATDQLDHTGEFTELSQAQTTVDTEPPSLSLSAPGRVAAGEDAAVEVHAADTASGVSALSWELDNSLPVSFAGNRFLVPAPLLEPGASHVVTVTATDGAGHTTRRQVSIAVERRAALVPAYRRRRPHLKLHRVEVRGHRIVIVGTVARGATGTVKVAIQAANYERTQKLHDGKWRARLTASHRGRYRLRIAYSGDRRFKPTVATRLVEVG